MDKITYLLCVILFLICLINYFLHFCSWHFLKEKLLESHHWGSDADFFPSSKWAPSTKNHRSSFEIVPLHLSLLSSLKICLLHHQQFSSAKIRESFTLGRKHSNLNSKQSPQALSRQLCFHTGGTWTAKCAPAESFRASRSPRGRWGLIKTTATKRCCCSNMC